MDFKGGMSTNMKILYCQFVFFAIKHCKNNQSQQLIKTN